ncbi:hypothetical protein [Streptomyces sp. NBC_01429]|uniref:hypothetical protein n=1 Tax=Streptomyces sp. NBC_01429 TaxID=2903862 RepID=UPI002E2DBE67|nr:hypothetical protein [Streptomyces sp. NBC_01429]
MNPDSPRGAAVCLTAAAALVVAAIGVSVYVALDDARPRPYPSYPYPSPPYAPPYAQESGSPGSYGAE